MDQFSKAYFERRERAERAAAKSATCPQARRVHQEMAQIYAALLQGHARPAPRQPETFLQSGLTILHR